MTLPDLQTSLERLGVKLSLRLVVDAPAGAMTPEVKEALATHKSTLLALLVGAYTSPDPSTPGWPPRPGELSTWPIPWHERWVELANGLQDAGVPWPQHEQLAF